jgi:hypothetical protein
MARFDARQLQQEIANLYLQFPELKGDDEMLKVDTLEGATNLKEFLSAVLDGYGKAQEGVIGSKARLDDIRARHTRYEMRVDFLRGMMQKILAAADIRKVELPEATLSMKNGQPKVIGEVDPAALPDEFCRIKREPDKEKIKTALLNGQTVDGFSLSNGEPSLAVYPR